MTLLRKIVLIASIAIANGNLLAAQEREFPVFKLVSHPFMPSLTAEYFYFSTDGLLWFSTSRGLTSFDGSEIVYYSTRKEADRLRLSNITAMTQASNDDFFIGTESNVFFYNRKNKVFSPLPLVFPNLAGEINTRIRSLYIDRNKLYIGLGSIGMQIYNLDTKKIETFDLGRFNYENCNCDLYQLNTVSSFAPHSRDSNLLWVGSFNGIYLFNKTTLKFSRRFEVENPAINIYRKTPFYCDIRHMDIADDSTIWFSTSTNGFGRYNTSSGKVKMFFHDARLKTEKVWKSYNFRSFARWHDDHYFLGITHPHPGFFNRQTKNLSLIKLENSSVFSDNVQYTTNDRLGNIWVLSRGKLYATAPRHYAFQVIDIKKQTTKDYLPNQLGKIYYDAETRQYFAAVIFSSGVYVFDSLMQFKKIIPVPLFTNKWTYRESCTEWITKDGSNRFWTSGMETYIYDRNNDRFEYAEKLFPALEWIKTKGECQDMATTAEGDVLMRFMNGDIFRIRHTTLETDSIKMPKASPAGNFEIGNAKIIYDSLHQKLYLNNTNAIIQYDIRSGAMRGIDSKIFFENIGSERTTIDHTLDSSGRLWLWIPSYGVRIIDPGTLSCIDSIPVGTKGLLSGNHNYIRYGGPGFIFLIGGEGFVIYNYEKRQSWLFAYNNGVAGPMPYFLGYSNGYLFANEINCILFYDLRQFAKINFSKLPVLNTITANDSVVYTRDEKKADVVARLKYNLNNLSFSFSAQEFFFPERVEYAYQLKGVDKDWHYTHSFNRRINYTKLPPGKYTFSLKAQMEGGNWDVQPVEYVFVIIPAIWQTGWFKVLCIALASAIIFWVARWRIGVIREAEKKKTMHEKDLLELEAKALRAQMNPHFIFNSLNSIKSLINKNENKKAAEYLTTFSKLIRTLFQNSDKREVSLFDELETCRLYTELEKMRFGGKIKFSFDIDPAVDLKDIKVPAMILQPFVENAFWHGLVPKEEGGNVVISVMERNGAVECIIDDDGIGRELSRLYESQYRESHESKGIGLTKSRMELDKLLNNREESIRIIDKVGHSGSSLGTTVVITFNELK